jgi:hypothetical protein
MALSIHRLGAIMKEEEGRRICAEKHTERRSRICVRTAIDRENGGSRRYGAKIDNHARPI